MAARRPSAYPPPVKVGEFVQAPEAEEDERIDVGVVFVGAGPAGLAGAIRLGQLLAEDPATAERLGETPIAVLDKGRVVGAHLLSGAVVNPSALRDLLPGQDVAALPGCFGPVTKEAVYLMSKSFEVRIPTPPPFHNKGNLVFSLSQLGRHMAELAEEQGAMVLPETDAQRLLVADGAVRGVKTGDKGLGREGEPLGSYEPGVEVHAQATVLSEGTQGHLARAAMERFGLRGEYPQAWSLGVKEVWRVAKPLDHVIHTLGWPFRTTRKDREIGGSFIYPMGPDMVAIGLVLGLDYRDSTLSVHDSLQLFKTHPMVRQLLEGGERIGWGAKTIPEGGFLALPSSLSMPGAVLTGDSAGFVNVPKLKGIHYAMRSGMLAAEAIYEQLKAGRDLSAPDALAGYDQRVQSSHIWSDLKKVRNMRQALGKGFAVGGPIGGLMDISRGALPPGNWKFHGDAEAAVEPHPGKRVYPAPDGKLTFDKLSSVFLSGNRSRDDQPNHIRVQENVPREVAEAWVAMCPAAVYEIGRDDGGPTVQLKLAPSNCVQCGAITAKGGRLTPPEGGSGPEYSNM
ncbi:MAG TPA: electron-transfer flavoprotein:ubiquinone oxidoreductase [Gaiellales bacterium]|nr:electron-transfer flavoprotein:ubiquinone oxidoreductase [Gaiellales bacterium]